MDAVSNDINSFSLSPYKPFFQEKAKKALHYGFNVVRKETFNAALAAFILRMDVKEIASTTAFIYTIYPCVNALVAKPFELYKLDKKYSLTINTVAGLTSFGVSVAALYSLGILKFNPEDEFGANFVKAALSTLTIAGSPLLPSALVLFSMSAEWTPFPEEKASIELETEIPSNASETISVKPENPENSFLKENNTSVKLENPENSFNKEHDPSV